MRLSRDDAKYIWSAIAEFAKYGFNKAHSVCYALIGYQCLFLKVNHPIEFFCSILNHSSKDKTLVYVKDALYYGIKVLPADVNRSGKRFKPIGDKEILYPISHLKFIRKCCDVIIENRPYDGLEDFMQKVKGKRVNKNAIISLIRAGAFDAFGKRDKIMYKFKKFIAKKATKKREAEVVEFEKWGPQDILEAEEMSYEFAFNASLIESMYIDMQEKYDCVRIKKALEQNGKVRIGGTVIKIKLHKTAKGTMAFVDFRFFNKSSSLTIFTDKWEVYSDRVKVGGLFYADAITSEYGGRKNFVLSGKHECFLRMINSKE